MLGTVTEPEFDVTITGLPDMVAEVIRQLRTTVPMALELTSRFIGKTTYRRTPDTICQTCREWIKANLEIPPNPKPPRHP